MNMVTTKPIVLEMSTVHLCFVSACLMYIDYIHFCVLLEGVDMVPFHEHFFQRRRNASLWWDIPLIMSPNLSCLCVCNFLHFIWFHGEKIWVAFPEETCLQQSWVNTRPDSFFNVGGNSIEFCPNSFLFPLCLCFSMFTPVAHRTFGLFASFKGRDTEPTNSWDFEEGGEGEGRGGGGCCPNKNWNS